jgi:hypothetical protein
MATATAAATSAQTAPQTSPPEIPPLSQEVETLQAFADVPSISAVHVQELGAVQDGKQDLWVTVSKINIGD